MTNRKLGSGLGIVGLALVTSMLAVACGSDDSGSSGNSTTGGSTSTGGESASGGSSSTGAATGSGGESTATGGATGSGGNNLGGAGGAASGGNTGADPCATYCNGQDGVVQQCGTTLDTDNPFTSEGDCVTQCNAQSNWDLACRQMHLDYVVGGQDKAFHCPHTVGKGGFCPDN